MKLIKVLTDKDIFNEELPLKRPHFSHRRSVKGIVRNNNNQIAMVYFDKADFHMLPGGKIDHGESNKKALIRESLEEIGYELEVKEALGRIIDYKYWMNQKNTTYCYFATIKGEKQKIRLTKEEISGGNATTVWFDSIDDAIDAHTQDNDDGRLWKNIKHVQLEILKEAKKLNN